MDEWNERAVVPGGQPEQVTGDPGREEAGPVAVPAATSASPAVPTPMSPAPQHGGAVNVHQYAQPPVLLARSGPNMFLRIIWYVFIGWWLSGWLMFAAGVCVASVILLPVGLALVNRLPTVLTLRPTTQRTVATMTANGQVAYQVAGAAQHPLWLRAIYFLCVGWWLCLLVMGVAYLVSLTIIGLPLAIMMLNRLPAATTLRRN